MTQPPRERLLQRTLLGGHRLRVLTNPQTSHWQRSLCAHASLCCLALRRPLWRFGPEQALAGLCLLGLWPWAGLSAVLGPVQASTPDFGPEQAPLLFSALSRPHCCAGSCAGPSGASPCAGDLRRVVGELQPVLCHQLQAPLVTTP